MFCSCSLPHVDLSSWFLLAISPVSLTPSHQRAIRSSSQFACAWVAIARLCCCATANAQAPPPRIEIGAVVSSGSNYPNGDYHVGGGGRLTVNATRYVAGEVELTHQPTGNSYSGNETHAVIALKGTYRAEQRRWLKFAGLNFFGVVGPAFLSRSVTIADPQPPPFCIRCTIQRGQTTAMLDYGGGLEVVPTRAVAVRFALRSERASASSAKV